MRSKRLRSAHSITVGQHLIDGNKRTALAAMLTYLELSGFRVKAADRELADWIFGLHEPLSGTVVR